MGVSGVPGYGWRGSSPESGDSLLPGDPGQGIEDTAVVPPLLDHHSVGLVDRTWLHHIQE